MEAIKDRDIDAFYAPNDDTRLRCPEDGAPMKYSVPEELWYCVKCDHTETD